MQKAAAQKKLSQKEIPAVIPTPPYSTLKENDVPPTKNIGETPAPEDGTRGTHGEEGVAKRKEVPESEQARAAKKPRVKMAARKRTGESEISRVELHGAGEPKILTLYAGENVILPATEKTVEEIQEEVRDFIPQVCVQIPC